LSEQSQRFLVKFFLMSYVEVGSFVNKACGVSGVGLFIDWFIVWNGNSLWGFTLDVQHQSE